MRLFGVSLFQQGQIAVAALGLVRPVVDAQIVQNHIVFLCPVRIDAFVASVAPAKSVPRMNAIVQESDAVPPLVVVAEDIGVAGAIDAFGPSLLDRRPPASVHNLVQIQ